MIHRIVIAMSCLVLAACEVSTQTEPAAWRAQCAPVEQPAPLSLEAARAAYRMAERRHALRFREAAEPGSFLREMHAALDAERMAAGEICLAELADRGELLFEHEYGYADGLGSGASRMSPEGPFRRVHRGASGGPETISCPSCHWIGGPNGAGSEVDGAFLSGDGERPAGGDERNPPALMGVGVVQALGREMSADLQQQRAELIREGKRGGEARLTSKGVDFGVLRTMEDGEIDTSGLQGVDADLVVKPFGWKGTFFKVSQFAADALQVHIGVQSDEILPTAAPEPLGAHTDAADPDGDGVRDELGRGPFTAMVAHLALLEVPIIEPFVMELQLEPAATGLQPPTTSSFVDDFQRGRRQFHALGCVACHVPMMVLKNPVVEIDGLPPIDLSREMRQPRLTYDATLGGYPVWLFSDLKRHNMGDSNIARHVQRGVARNEYLTPRLWGLCDSAPYLHDGRAPSLDYAIAGHDGEGAAARAGYAALAREEQGALRVYLMSLRRAPRVIVP